MTGSKDLLQLFGIDVNQALQRCKILAGSVFKRYGVIAEKSGISFDDFWSMCAEKLYKEFTKMQKEKKEKKICISHNFVKKMFSHLFIDEIRELNPDYRARNKQVGRLVNIICYSDELIKKRCRLLGILDEELDLMGKDELALASTELKLPKLNFSEPQSNETSEKKKAKSPWIKEVDMLIFLFQLLRRVKLTTKENLVQFIWSKYWHLYPNEVHISDVMRNDNEVADDDDKTDPYLLGFRPAKEHYRMARELYEKMVPDIRSFHYYHVVKDYSLNKSATCIEIKYNDVKKIEESHQSLIKRFFFQKKNDVEPGEMTTILTYISDFIRKEIEEVAA